LTASRRAVRLCVKASPSEDAEISVSNSVAELALDIEFAVEMEAGSSFGVSNSVAELTLDIEFAVEIEAGSSFGAAPCPNTGSWSGGRGRW